MLVRRFYDERLAQASYLVGCERTGEAIAVDPARNASQYVDAARRDGLRITRVTETHIHADFVSGTRELAALTGATPLISAEGAPDWLYRWPDEDHPQFLRDGDRIEMGGVVIDVLHTPGHTPEHLSFIVTDRQRSDDPVAILSGDFLFVGDVGRPDLLERAVGVADSAVPAARSLFRSLQRLAPFPDYLQVWPGHGAGSACGKALGSLPTSTLGYERRTNRALQANGEEEFVAAVLAGQPASPPYFARMKAMNRDGPPIHGTVAVPILEASALAGALQRGLVIDVRSTDAFARGHLAGTLNIPLTRAFTKWAGWLVPYDRELYLLAPDETKVREAEVALAAIGHDMVVGGFGLDAIAARQLAGNIRKTRRHPIADAPTLAD
ncbi:MAG: MBL fold metallo-hydrolase, partial [Gemmatimonadales bacterium]